MSHHVIDAKPNSGTDCCTDVCLVGDINGDGYPDVVIGAEKAEFNGLVWYEYPHWQKRPIATGEFSTDGQLADLDADGDLDVVVSKMHEGIFWFENPGKPEEYPWIPHPINDVYGHDVALGDLDGDGDMDVVVCDKKRLMLSLQISPDQWKTRTLLTKNGEGIALADLDADGDLDIVYGNIWLETPQDVANSDWKPYLITKDWPETTRVGVADLSGDGRLDIVLSVSEANGRLAWFESPQKIKSESWKIHWIERKKLEGVHSLNIADMDNDGDLDLIVAEMHTSAKKRVMIYLQTQGKWDQQILTHTGSHNMKVADVDLDGDIDIIGKNFGGPDRKIEWWENLTNDRSLDRWQYVAIDTKRPDDEFEKMGLVFGDIDHDGFADVIAGGIAYLNPQGHIQNRWRRIKLPLDIDVFFFVDVDDDDFSDLIGFHQQTIFWIEAKTNDLKRWSVKKIGSLPPGRTQGYIQGQLIAGGKPELVFTRGKNLFCLQIPEMNPTQPNEDQTLWPLTLISSKVEEEGIDLGDVDRDGDLDIAAYDHDSGSHQVIWFENPGDLQTPWSRYEIGKGAQWLDRIALADLNGDGRLDIVSTEETQDWNDNASMYWFEAPLDQKQTNWPSHRISTLRSINSLSVFDMDKDGDLDIIVAEHTDLGSKKHPALDNLTVIYENRDQGAFWIPHTVEVGPHSSHLGARVYDLDQDGDLDIVSIAWKQYTHLHLWENLAQSFKSRHTWEK